MRENTIGSDLFPIAIKVGVELVSEHVVREGRWMLERADWEKFREISESRLVDVNQDQGIENLCREISNSLLTAAEVAIPKSKSKDVSRIVPWWSKDCSDSTKNRNRAFRILKRTHNFQSMIEYKRLQAIVRQTIRKGKKVYWQR